MNLRLGLAKLLHLQVSRLHGDHVLHTSAATQMLLWKQLEADWKNDRIDHMP